MNGFLKRLIPIPVLAIGASIAFAVVQAPTYLDSHGHMQGAQGVFPINPDGTSGVLGPTTGTAASVNDGAASVTVLALNTSRRGATFYNDSTSTLYLLIATGTASATNYSVQMGPGAYFELPTWPRGVYTGDIKGIWSSDASGAVRVTEYQ